MLSTDPDNHTLTNWVEWDGQTYTFPTQLVSDTVGTFVMTFYSADFLDTTSISYTIDVTLPPNNLPFYTEITPNDTTIVESDSVYISAVADDLDGEELTILFIDGIDSTVTPYWFFPAIGLNSIEYFLTDQRDTVIRQEQ